MAELKYKIEAELENINLIFENVPSVDKLPYLSVLEIAGVATLIHNFYNGLENIIKQILLEKKIPVPQGGSWHKDLLDLAVNHNIVSEKIRVSLSEYLAFRHFFNHAYAFELYPERIESLVENLENVYEHFKDEISIFC